MPVVTELIFLGVLRVFFTEQSSLHIMELYTLNAFFFSFVTGAFSYHLYSLKGTCALNYVKVEI
jgi:hypothetical protein